MLKTVSIDQQEFADIFVDGHAARGGAPLDDVVRLLGNENLGVLGRELAERTCFARSHEQRIGLVHVSAPLLVVLAQLLQKIPPALTAEGRRPARVDGERGPEETISQNRQGNWRRLDSCPDHTETLSHAERCNFCMSAQQ